MKKKPKPGRAVKKSTPDEGAPIVSTGMPSGTRASEGTNSTKRKQAEEELWERDIQFNKLCSLVPGMIYKFSKKPDGTYCVPFTTDAIRGIFGCSPQDVREDFSPIARVILPEDFDRVVDSIEYSAKHLTVWTCEYRVQIPGQSIRWIEGKSTPEKLADGSITWHGFNTDITDRKRMEDETRALLSAVQEEKTRLTALIGSITDEVWFANTRGRFILANPSALREFGLPPDGQIDVKKLAVSLEVFRPDGSPRPVEEAPPLRALSGEVVSNQEEIVRTPVNGELRYRQVSSTPVRDSGGHIIGSVSVVRDITERKRAEENLQKSEENFRRSLDDSPLGVRIITGGGETIYANQAILDIYGFSSMEELRTTPVEKRYTAESYIEFKKRYERRKQGEDSQSEYEVSIVRKNGQVRHLLVSRKELLWNGNKQYQTLYRDITERKRAEEALRASLREKEVLLREIHHRVKNNMQVISSLFNLQSGHTLNQECREILKKGQTRIRAMSLVHEKLYQSRDLSKIDLAGYIQSLAVHLLHVYVVNPDQVRLETDFGDVSLDINSAVPCGLILNELISNALKHAFPEGRQGLIRIELSRGPDDQIVLRVADDGIGFPKDSDFRLAESFGLQIVNLLVGQLDAALTLDRDQGTVITVTFRELKYAPRI